MPTPPRASALSGDSGGLIAKSDPPLHLAKLPCGAHQIALDLLSAMRLRGWDLWRGRLPGLDFLNLALDELSSSLQCALELRNLALGPIDPAIQSSILYAASPTILSRECPMPVIGLITLGVA
jgi:hypothetical protein